MNDPHDRDRPATDVRRAHEERLHAAEQYRLGHHQAYREHTAQRHAASLAGWEEAERLHPGVGEIRKAHRHARLYLRKWDKAHPNPLTWEEYERLGNEYAATIASRDPS